MMKIVTPKQMAQAESMAYADGLSEMLFMDNAGAGVARIVNDFVHAHHCQKQAILLCSKGNNSGDAYVAGCRLIAMGYQVSAFHVGDIQEATALCKKQHECFRNAGGIIHPFSPSAQFPSSGIIVDGLFGTGFHGTVRDEYAAIIDRANDSGLPIIAIDIPSGLNGTTGEVIGTAIRASATIFLGYPKRGFFLKDGWNHVGILHGVDFGLPEKYMTTASEGNVRDPYMLTTADLASHLPRLVRNRHKYQAGYVVSLAGSPSMPGAAILCSTAALKAGAGIVRLFYPKGMEAELAAAPYELIKQPYMPDQFDSLLEEWNRASAVIVGPGLGTGNEVQHLLKTVMPHLTKPCVIDADALTLFASNPYPLPVDTILTPHHGEMARLLQETATPPLDDLFIERCQQYAEQHKVTLVLKGAPTWIFYPGEAPLVSTSGDPGMATAGSGDVLTGVIAGLLAQKVPARFAAALGVYIHGLAGMEAAKHYTSYCMTATDIMNVLHTAFRVKGTSTIE